MTDRETNKPAAAKVPESLSLFEISQLVGGQEKVAKYIEPLISKAAEGGAMVMDRDISGHIHTTG